MPLFDFANKLKLWWIIKPLLWGCYQVMRYDSRQFTFAFSQPYHCCNKNNLLYRRCTSSSICRYKESESKRWDREGLLFGNQEWECTNYPAEDILVLPIRIAGVSSPDMITRASNASGLLWRIIARALVAAPSEEFPWSLWILIMTRERFTQK